MYLYENVQVYQIGDKNVLFFMRLTILSILIRQKIMLS